ncbi:Branched-chain amino acid transport system / permease component [Roseovarius sp. EC-HK134]|uniref:ABC transporter permease subunit n=1 Tax=unclassified Roseovarius TaxID=2614913 RepID=UPI00125A708A|nr:MULTISPECIES: urea ABC transporter permease subunit UrtC [unclassified Roseovarius]VVS98012.1 Branched-chain amino acid transport system / permease component [Roseovarius sp. EC-HK134]VVS98780.1 Branched-chain amino acid transport system / permease component [Roseovarius sp. EC-SD190]
MTHNAYHNKTLQWLFYIAVLAVLGAVPLISNDAFLLNQLAIYGVYGMLAVSISLCWGSGGILNMGQGIAFGLGAYCMAMTMQMQTQADGTIPPFMLNNGLDSLPLLWQPFQNTSTGIFLALFVPTVFYLIFGGIMFTARVSGPFFAIMTLATLSAFATIFVDLQPYTNGVNGISPPSSLKLDQTEIDPYSSGAYWFVFALLAACTVAAKLINQSRFGLIVRALKDDPERVRFLGYNVAIYETLVYTLSGLIAAIAGCCFAVLTQYVSPAQFEVGFSISIVIWVALGGRNSLIWAMFGAFTVQGAQSYVGDQFLSTWILILGFSFILVVRFLPGGLAGLVETLLGRTTKLKMEAEHANLEFSDGKEVLK